MTTDDTPRLTASFLIPTYNRPDSLARCLQSLLQQTRLPDELLIIDDGDLECVPQEAALQARGVDVRLFRKDRPGLVASRNLGIEQARCDILFFSEDDVVLEPDYVAAIMRVFETDPTGGIGGVAGLIANERRSPVQGLILMLLSVPLGLTALREGRMLRSGFAGEYGESPIPIRTRRKVDFLAGGVCACRLRAIGDLRFSDKYSYASGYGQGEDKDFSYRLSRRTGLVAEPAARLAHYPAAKHNFDHVGRGRAMILYRYLFFRNCLLERPWHWIAFAYSMLGYTLLRLLVMCFKPTARERGRMRGIFQGWRQVLTRRTGTHL